MKKILFLLLLLPVFAWAQPCADEDTVRNNATSLLTATSVRINGTISHFSGSYVTLYLKYVRSGMTDTVTVSGVNPLRNLSGLQPSTLYRYYYMTSCASGSEYQLGTYTFTTLSSSVAYVYERPTYFNYIRADTGLTVPRVDTALYRSPNTAGGDIVFKTSDSKFYGYNGSYWQWLGVDSAGILPTLNLKVDSVTVSGDSLFYWVNGTGYGYILPANSNDWQLDGNTGADNFLGTTDNTSLRFRTNNTAVAVLDSNGRFGIGTNSPLYQLDVYKSENTDVLFRVKNDNAGVGASTNLNVDNGTSSGGIFHTGTGYTTVDYILPNQTSFGGNGSGGVALGAGAGAPIKFYQVQTEVARFSSNGIFGVGTTTPDSLITSHLGLHAKRGVRFSGLLDFADTTDWKPLVADVNGTVRKATYWPGSGVSSNIYNTSDVITDAATRTVGVYGTSTKLNLIGKDVSTDDVRTFIEYQNNTPQLAIGSTNNDPTAGFFTFQNGSTLYSDNRGGGVATGIVYAADYSADYTDRSLVDKGYITTSIAAKANIALDNLASVAINTSLISDADNTDDLGSTANSWKDIFTRTVKFDGSTSGTATIAAPAVAATPILTLPIATGTLVQYVETSITSSASPTPTGDAKFNYYYVTALATAPTFGAPTSPGSHNWLMIVITDNGTARALSWNAAYTAGTDLPLPTTTVISKNLYCNFHYNGTTWDLVGLTQLYLPFMFVVYIRKKKYKNAA